MSESRSRENISSSSNEEDNPMIHMMAQLIKQQDRIIEEIAGLRFFMEQNFRQGNAGLHTEEEEEEPIEITIYNPEEEEERLPVETRHRRLKLYQTAFKGDWEVAKRILEEHPDDIGAEISEKGDTVLHIATAAKHIQFVEELIKMMNEDDVLRKNNTGSTALSIAAASGKMKLVELIINKNINTAMISDYYTMLPVDIAASAGHKDIVEYLIPRTEIFFDEVDCIELLITSIKTDLYDVALYLLERHPELATCRASNSETALHALVQKHLPSSNPEQENNKDLQQRQLVERIWKSVILLSDSKISKLIERPWRLIFEATKQGNLEFLMILIREYPDLIWKFDEDGRTIFHIAVLYRQEEIFKFICDTGSFKDLIVFSKDKNDNNILHLAGFMAPTGRLDSVAGPAFQLNRELWWFKEVKEVVPSRLREATNKAGFTPRALFEKEHQALREKSEKWLKETATSCMVVAALIATVAFGAAFTVPGGNNEDTGLPFFLEKLPFMIFSISDAISLVFSCTSMFEFLSIFTSHRAQEDFRLSSPGKLNVGMAALLVSITAMMVMFSSAFFIAFKDGKLWIAIFVAIFASFPVVFSIRQHERLVYDALRTTYASDNSLFQPGNIWNIFFKPEEAVEHHVITIKCPC